MTDLYYYDIPNTVKIRAEKIRADEFLYKDPETGTYIPLVPGGGEAPELPYWTKSAKADFLADSLRTTVDQTGVDVINIAGNTASELTSTALTLGDTNGNASLTKSGIAAVNNLKDAISGTVNTSYNDSQSVLIYDSTAGKLAKANAFRLRNTATTYSVLSPVSHNLSNGNSYSALTASGVSTYYDTLNLLSLLRGGTLTIGTSSAGSINNTLPNTQLGRFYLKISDGTTIQTLDHAAVKAAANLATVVATTPSVANKMVVYDPTTSVYAYHDTPAEVVLPDYVKPVIVDFTANSLRTTVDQTGVDVIDIAANTASELSSIALTLGDVSGNASLTKASVVATNKLKDAISEAINTTEHANQSVLIYDAAAGKISRNSAFRLRESALNYSVFSPTAVSVKNGSGYTEQDALGLTTYYGHLNAISTLAGSVFTIGTRSSGKNIDTTSPYTRLTRTDLQIGNGATVQTLDHAGVKATANLANLASLVPDVNTRMVTFNPTTKVFTHSDMPSGAATVPKIYTLTIPAYSGSTSFLPRFTSETLYGSETPVGDTSATLRRYLLNVGDTLILKTFGGEADPACLYYNTWYCVAISKSAVNYTSAKFSASLVNVPPDAYAHTIDITSSPINHPAVPIGSILFRIKGTNGSTERANTVKFYGSVAFRVLSYETSDSPAPATV